MKAFALDNYLQSTRRRENGFPQMMPQYGSEYP
jgi:hypothetical protein